MEQGQQIARIVQRRVIFRDGTEPIPRPDKRNSCCARAFQIHLRISNVDSIFQAVALDDKAVVFPFAQPRAAWMFKIREIRCQPMRFKKRLLRFIDSNVMTLAQFNKALIALCDAKTDEEFNSILAKAKDN